MKIQRTSDLYPYYDIFFKPYEHLILNYLSLVLKNTQSLRKLALASSGQVLNIIQHIKDGFKKAMVTGAIFVDLTAVYDTINDWRYLAKIYDMTLLSHNLIMR